MMRRLLIAVMMLCPSLWAQISFTVADTSGTYTSAGIGMNISAQDFFLDYYTKNYFSRNPSMQGQIGRQIEPVASGTTTSFTTSITYDAIPANFAVGYTVIVACHGSNGTSNGGDCTGGAKGYIGTVTANTTSTGSAGPTFTVTPAASTAFANTDSVWLISPATVATPSSGISWNQFGWGPNGTVTIDTTSGDLPPNLTGGFAYGQCLKMTSTSASPAYIVAYLDSGATQNMAFNGNWHIGANVIDLGGASGLSLGISVVRSTTGGINYSGTTALSGSTYTTISQAFTGTETNTLTPTIVTIQYTLYNTSATPASICMVAPTLTNDADNNPTVFRNQVVSDLQSMNLPILRFNSQGVFQGETLLNWITPIAARQTVNTGFGTYTTNTPMDIGLHDFLTLAQYLGIKKVSIATPPTWTATDEANLTDYLHGGSGTTYGAYRIALGQTAGWDTVFSEIDLAQGNEAWNFGSFPSTSYNYYTSGSAYWNYTAPTIAACAALKASASWNGAVMQCVANQQTGLSAVFGPFMIAQDTTNAVDKFEINQYGMFDVTSCASPVPWRSAYSEAWANSNTASPASYFSNSVGLGRPTQVYEYGNSTNSGSCTQSQLNDYPDGEGYGLVNTMMSAYANKVLGIVNNIQWQYTQPGTTLYTITGNPTIYQWNQKTGVGGSMNNFVPTEYAQSMYNSCANLGTGFNVNGTNVPTINTSAENGVNATTNQPLLDSFGYKSGTTRCLLIVNHDTANSYTFTIGGTNAPTGTVTEVLYSSANLTDNNNGANTTPTNFNTTSSPSNPTTYTLPAHSQMTLTYSTAAAATGATQLSGGTHVSGGVTIQ